jgi:hypothetical protein
MRYGEIKERKDQNFSTPSEAKVVFKGKDIEVSLWSANRKRQEIFPPSKALVYLTKNKIVCKKRRSVREKETIIGAPGYIYPATLHVTRNLKGWQWIIFRTDEISNMGRTYLLDHVIKINSDSGDYEVIISKGKQAKKLISKVEKCIDDR